MLSLQGDGLGVLKVSVDVSFRGSIPEGKMDREEMSFPVQQRS